MFSIGWIGDCAEGTDSRRVAPHGKQALCDHATKAKV